MAGYYEDEAATAQAFRGGWFHTGDLGVVHPDGYVELRDRAKDVIISGGENVSTIEVEQTIVRHPAVLEAAVVGIPDDRTGEAVRAWVVPSPGEEITPEGLLDFLRDHLARFKWPRDIQIVEELPHHVTGKVLRRILRDEREPEASGDIGREP
jgi:fatty-acyl-CoA synthase